MQPGSAVVLPLSLLLALLLYSQSRDRPLLRSASDVVVA
jgi:hypothetical protein